MAHIVEISNKKGESPVWSRLRVEAATVAAGEPVLASMLHAVILNHDRLEDALSYLLATKIGGENMNIMQVREICDQALHDDPGIIKKVAADALAVMDRDPACKGLIQPFLFYKGFLALQAQRIAHQLWHDERQTLALYMQSRVSELFAVDIHPATKIGSGIMMDHATGIVIGETAQVGNDVSIMQDVTLGGTGSERGDRHPKIRDGVLVGAGAKVLGNITVGDHARIAACSVVLKDVPPRCTVAGIPAKPVGECCPEPAKSMNHMLEED